MSEAPTSATATAGVRVRPLTLADREAAASLLDDDPGYGLFPRSNLIHLGRGLSLARYWGAFAGSRLTALAMDVSGRVALYAPVGSDVSPLLEIVAPSTRFTMGRPDLVDALLGAVPPAATIQLEEHMLAAVEVGLTSPPGPLRSALAPAAQGDALLLGPDGPRAVVPHEERGSTERSWQAVVRRATLLDVPALTELYVGSAGFEDADPDAVRRTVAGRVRSLRTFLVETEGRVVAAASSTGETPRAAMVGGVWTAPHARNRGYASAVVAALTSDLCDAGLRPYLFYLRENAPAARVYARIGYREVGAWSVATIAPGPEPTREVPGSDAHE